MSEIDWDSTPGCCSLKCLGTTNKQIFGWDGVRCDPERVEFVRATVRDRFNRLANGEAIADNINVFVKREPTSVAKEALGRYRLISGVSLIDSLVDRVLFGWLLRAVVSRATETPCMVGWSPMRGGWRHIWRKFRGTSVACLDKSAWDWTVVEWMVHAFRSFLVQLPVNPPQWWVEMVEIRIRLLYKDAVFEFQDGTIVHQKGWGVQKSGSLLTIIFNSVLQSICHYLTNYEMGLKMDLDEPITLGDDTAQKKPLWFLKYVSILQSLGPKIKDPKTQHWVEFAGFSFLPRSCVPAYWRKHLFKLRYAENPIETLQSYQLIYSHDPVMFEYLEKQLLRFGPQYVRPRSWCIQVMDEEE